MSVFKFSTLALAVSVLTGCASISGYDSESGFACAAPDGVSCTSVSGVHANAKEKNLPSQRDNAGHKSTEPQVDEDGKVIEKAPLQIVNRSSDTFKVVTGMAPSNGTPIYQNPEVLRVWFTPWEDKDAMLHDQSYVYLTVQKQRWNIEHIKSNIIEESRLSVNLEN